MIESFLLDIDPIEVSDNFQEKYLIFHIEGGLGKHIAATALLKDLSISLSPSPEKLSFFLFETFSISI